MSDLPGGGQEILFPSLVPNEQITVSYLYLPPVTWDQINLGVKSDEGFAKVIRVIPMRLYPKWLNKLAAVFLLAGEAVYSISMKSPSSHDGTAS